MIAPCVDGVVMMLMVVCDEHDDERSYSLLES